MGIWIGFYLVSDWLSMVYHRYKPCKTNISSWSVGWSGGWVGWSDSGWVGCLGWGFDGQELTINGIYGSIP